MKRTGIGRYGSAQRVTGVVWGNGEFGFCVQRSFALTPSHKCEGGEAKEWSLYRPHLSDLQGEIHGQTQGRYERVDLRVERARRPPIEIGEDTYSELGLSDLANSHTRAARGSKGITRYGQKLVRNAGFELQRQFKKERLAFLTLTIPPLEYPQFLELLDGWSEVVRVFVQWLRRRLKKAFLPSHVVGCSEVQEDRFAETHLPYPHLHLVYVGRYTRGNWAVNYLDIRAAWMRAVNTVISVQLTIQQCKSVEQCVRVEKSVSDYLGKYMSKGIEVLHAVLQVLDRETYLSAYYTVSLQLKKKVLSSRIVGNGKVMSFLQELCEEQTHGVFTWLRKIYIGDGADRLPWGYAGNLTEWGMQVMRDFLSIQ